MRNLRIWSSGSALAEIGTLMNPANLDPTCVPEVKEAVPEQIDDDCTEPDPEDIALDVRGQ
mgnify:CR=1 FL=1